MFQRLVKHLSVDVWVFVLALEDTDVILDVHHHSIVAHQLPSNNLCLLSLLEIDSDTEILAIFPDLVDEVTLRGERQHLNWKISPQILLNLIQTISQHDQPSVTPILVRQLDILGPRKVLQLFEALFGQQILGWPIPVIVGLVVDEKFQQLFLFLGAFLLAGYLRCLLSDFHDDVLDVYPGNDEDVH